MKTLKIENGDLVISNGAYAVVEGSDKIVQDLGIAVATPYGVDRFHPKYGSVLPNYVGTPIDEGTKMLVENEMTRIITNYQAVQTTNMNSYIVQGKQSPYNQNELVQSIKELQVVQDYDTLEVTAVVSTLSGNQAVVSATVSPNSVVTGN